TIQRCVFELIVSDGDLLSRPDAVEIIIVPSFSSTTLVLENPPFDPDKPTFIFFGGGNGGSGLYAGPPWEERANMISFSTRHNGRMWSEHGNAIIVYLSSVAPDYKQRIQTSGFSKGARLPIVVGAYINTTYADSRYNVNHATVFDGPNPVLPEIPDFLNSSVGGEQSWVDNYRAGPNSAWPGKMIDGALTVYFPLGDHGTPVTWYLYSIDPDNVGWIGDVYNHGITAGPYYSVIGPGKNLELAPHSSSVRYYFEWDAPLESPGTLEFYDESLYPGRLPELPTLVGPADGDTVDANGVVLSCQVCQNVVGYQLLVGPNPHDLKYIISDTPTPPENVITAFPHETIYWTIKVRDQYGSTIFPDPVRIESETVSAQPIENVTTGKRYPSIQGAINDAAPGDEIAVSPGSYRHFENIDFKGKAVTVRSTDPNDPDIVAATVINARSHSTAAVTFSSGEDANSVLAGLTITGGDQGIYCSEASPTISKCTIKANKGPGVRLWKLGNPTITQCNVVANGGTGIEMILYQHGRYVSSNYPTITNCIVAANSQYGISGGVPTIANCTIAENLKGGIDASKATVTNSIIYFNGDGSADAQISSGAAEVTYTDVQGSHAGVGNIDADPYFVSLSDWAGTGAKTDGDYHLKSTGARWSTELQTWTADDVTSPCIDAGNPGTPLRAEPLSLPDDLNNEGSRNLQINMGAYGGTSHASLAAGD
ncbi:MAG: right-handed parallel beta-helix repeat-containing protein, partial [Planctomycetota bacterium]